MDKRAAKSLLDDIGRKSRDMLSFVESLVNIDSGADHPEGSREVAAIIGGKLEGIGFAVQYLDYPGVCTHLLAERRGLSQKKVMLLGHTDTIFSLGTAAARPFTVRGGRAYGPGVLDMKAGIAVAILALSTLHEQGWQKNNVTVMLCGDEEKGHRHSDGGTIIGREGRGKDVVFCLEPGADDGGVTIGRKGVASPEVNITGRSAHAGREPQKGASAVVELAHKTLAIHSLNDYDAGVTFNVGVVSGGTVSNAVPDRAYAKVDIRFKTTEQAEAALYALRQETAKVYVPGTTTKVSNDKISMPPMEITDASMKMLRLVQEQSVRLGLPTISGNYLGGGSDAAWTVQAGAPTICSMGVCGGFAHSDAEYVIVDSLAERAKLLALCLDAV